MGSFYLKESERKMSKTRKVIFTDGREERVVMFRKYSEGYIEFETETGMEYTYEEVNVNGNVRKYYCNKKSYYPDVKKLILDGKVY